jgi:hypothetical protein
MEIYKDRGNDSGVLGYHIGNGFIDVIFKNHILYRWTDSSAGPQRVKEMIRLARFGQGLNRYITTEVRNQFAARRYWRPA